MKKRILCIALVSLCLLSFTACSFMNKTSKISTDEVISSDGNVHITDLEGKTYSEVIDAGYIYTGRISSNGTQTLMLKSYTIPEDAKSSLNSLTEMTIGDLISKNINVGCINSHSDHCKFNIKAGSVNINFDAEDSAEILKKYENKIFFSVTDEPELHDKKILNPEIDSIDYTLIFKEDISSLTINSANDSMLNDYVVAELYYTPIKADFE